MGLDIMVKKIGGDQKPILEFTASVDAATFLKSKIQEIKGTANIAEDGKSFQMGNDDTGHLSGKKGAFGGWKINGESRDVSDVEFKHPKADVKVVVEATAVELAVMFADTKSMASAISQAHGLKPDQIDEATIHTADSSYDVLDDAPG